MKQALTLIALALAAAAANAAEFGLHVGSHHFPQKAWQQNSNPGAYVVTDGGYVFGGYRNSLGRASFYAAKVFNNPLELPEVVAVDITIGTISGYGLRGGYGIKGGDILPLVTLSHKFGAIMGVSPRVSFVPGIAKTSAVLHLSLEWSL